MSAQDVSNCVCVCMRACVRVCVHCDNIIVIPHLNWIHPLVLLVGECKISTVYDTIAKKRL